MNKIYKYLLIFSFMETSVAFANELHLNKIIAIQQAQLEMLKEEVNIIQQQLNKNDLHRVGAIQASVLNEDMFKKFNGNDWVLMDGRSISGSILHEETGMTNAPDARGRFLRNSGGKAAPLLQNQGYETAVASLKTIASGVTGKVSIDHDHPAFSVSGGDHTHRLKVNRSSFTGSFTSLVADSGRDNNVLSSGVPLGAKDGGHSHNIDVPNFSTGLRNIQNAVASAQRLEGGVETRPENLTVNYFLKIN